MPIETLLNDTVAALRNLPPRPSIVTPKGNSGSKGNGRDFPSAPRSNRISQGSGAASDLIPQPPLVPRLPMPPAPENARVGFTRNFMRKMVKKKASLHRLMDTDKNNMVTFDEFCRGIALSGIRPVPTAAQYEALFHAFDANKDMRISYEEMVSKLEEEGRAMLQEASTWRPRPRAKRPPPAVPTLHAIQATLPALEQSRHLLPPAHNCSSMAGCGTSHGSFPSEQE